MGTFGNTDMKGAYAAGWSGVIWAFKYPLSEEGILQSISILLSTAAGNVRLAVYEDDAGAPSALLAETASVAASNGWNPLNTLTNPTLPAGDYWLALQVSSADTTVYYQSGAVNQRAYVAWAYGAFPALFGAANYTDHESSIYGTYTPTAVGVYAGLSPGAKLQVI